MVESHVHCITVAELMIGHSPSMSDSCVVVRRSRLVLRVMMGICTKALVPESVMVE